MMDLNARRIPPVREMGWSSVYSLAHAAARAVLVPDIGRLVHFSTKDGPNALRLDPSLTGHLPPEGDPFFNIGGHWLWPVNQTRWRTLSDDARDWPPPAPLTDGPWKGSAWTDADGGVCVRMSRTYGAPLFIQASRVFRLDPNSAVLTIRQRIERTAPSVIPVVLWSISQLSEARAIALPVEADSRFRDGLNTLKGQTPGQQLAACGDITIFRTGAGGEIKLGTDSPRHWIAAALPEHVLVESVEPKSEGNFPDGGCRTILYANPAYGYAELETLSPEVMLEPGQALENILRMEILPGVPPSDAAAWADVLRRRKRG